MMTAIWLQRRMTCQKSRSLMKSGPFQRCLGFYLITRDDYSWLSFLELETGDSFKLHLKKHDLGLNVQKNAEAEALFGHFPSYNQKTFERHLSQPVTALMAFPWLCGLLLVPLALQGCGDCRRANWKWSPTMLFPTCQVRVVRFYVCCPPPSPSPPSPLLPPLRLFLLVFADIFAVLFARCHQMSTWTSRLQWAAPDLNSDSRLQWAAPDLNRGALERTGQRRTSAGGLWSGLGNAGPHPGTSRAEWAAPDLSCQKICQKMCQKYVRKECQKICQKKCQKKCQ